MAKGTRETEGTKAAPRTPFPLFLRSAVLVVILLLLLHVVAVEPFVVPTGSMAPTLLGNHQTTRCPGCGCPVVVGVPEDRTGDGRALCPNCGFADIDLEGLPVVSGDQVLVNLSVFDFRSPRRWEIAVFRCPADPSRVFVKRVVGRPGESVQVKNGDVWIDHDIARKSISEARNVRVPVHDQSFPPRAGWSDWWERTGDDLELDEKTLLWKTAGRPDYQWFVYRNWSLSEHKARAVTDEYSYNGSIAQSAPVPVHDFFLEAEVDIGSGQGSLALGITDGKDDLLAELPAGDAPGGAILRDGGRKDVVYRNAPGFALAGGRMYRVELAFVDRRATLTVNGATPFEPVDRPAVEWRSEVSRPVRLGVRGVEARVRNLRLWRDVHYTNAGRHGIRSPVRLGTGEYFVLGDNSPNSDDSRFWTDREDNPVPVRETDFLGKPFLVHLPGTGRMRWLR